jgi:phosphoglycolate phosphatase
VLTNKPGDFARQILQGLGLLEKFHGVVGGDEAPKKPDPAGLRSLCAKLGADPARTLYIGDHTIDIATGAAASVPVCAVGWGFGDPEELQKARPSHFCSTPSDLLRLLARLASD